jgi:Arc/MetJ-type ribon-helix-helix transcriptional regulator
MNEMIHLRLDEKMRREIRKTIDENLFSNESEFIRDSIRRNIELYQKIMILKSLRGSVKKRRNFKGIPPSDIFREFGLE